MYIPQNKLAKWRKNNTPDKCPVLNRDTEDWVVDHDHENGEIRGVISRQANTLIGKIENIFTSMCRGNPRDLPDVLENIATYLRQPGSDLLHPVGLNQLTSRFKNNLLKDDQCFLLVILGASNCEVNACVNVKARVKIFKELLKKFYDKENTTDDSDGTQSSEGSDKQIRRVLLSLRRGYIGSNKTSIKQTQRDTNSK